VHFSTTALMMRPVRRPLVDLNLIELSPVRDAAGYAAGRVLIEEYAATLGVDLCFQSLEDELAHLSQIYGPPGGALWLAGDGRGWCGCAALRALSPEICEMKRLYVQPAARGAALGRRLAEALIAQARELGYRRMRLDTLAQMQGARRLYASLGFQAIAPYYRNPLPGVLYLELALGRDPAAP
jgi:GNAT superfamily N-acetyltransferase